MVNIDSKLAEIKELVDEKQYFVINRARQYGKTTTLNLLVKYLADQYTVFFISFEGLEVTSVFTSAFLSLLRTLFLALLIFGIISPRFLLNIYILPKNYKYCKCFKFLSYI